MGHSTLNVDRMMKWLISYLTDIKNNLSWIDWLSLPLVLIDY